jgi:holo-[acyl-carrier protein] synthase
MLVGTGIDLIEIARVARSLERFGERFLHRIYTPAEIGYCLAKRNAAESLAARFAAKEAAAKALGTGISAGVGWREIEVTREPSGRPGLRLSGRALARSRLLGAAHASLSLTHGRAYAIASVHLET